MNQTSLLKCELILSELHTDLVQKANVPFKRKLFIVTFIVKNIHRLFKAGLTFASRLDLDWMSIFNVICNSLCISILANENYNIVLFVKCLNVHMIFWTNDQFKLYFTRNLHTWTIDFNSPLKILF